MGEPVQGIELSPTQLENGSIIPLKFVKFQNVQNIQFFIKDNQEGGDITRLDYLGLIGTPISTTNMDDFKRISGKKRGERVALESKLTIYIYSLFILKLSLCDGL